MADLARIDYRLEHGPRHTFEAQDLAVFSQQEHASKTNRQGKRAECPGEGSTRRVREKDETAGAEASESAKSLELGYVSQL
jgi:hypothetical protein